MRNKNTTSKLSWSEFVSKLENPRYRWYASIDPDQPVPGRIYILELRGDMLHLVWLWEGTTVSTSISGSDNLELELVDKKYWKARCLSGYDVYLSKETRNKETK